MCDDRLVRQLADLVATSHAAWRSHVVTAVLSTDEPEAVAEKVTHAVADTLGVPVVAARFYEPGVGIVAGLELADGRAVVVKIHRPTLVSSERLAAIAAVQAELAAIGVPAPMPLAGPVPLGEGWLMIESLREGDRADGAHPAVRRSIAATLHQFVVAARPFVGTVGLDPWIGPPVAGDLWPEPHDLRFDFAATAAGAEWIDEAARHARQALADRDWPVVVGHLDWRVQNLGFTGSEVTAIYDWDSVCLVPEAALVGAISVVHPVDWRSDVVDHFPSLAQIDAFVVDYEAARGTPFDGDERPLLTAGQRWIASYGARCQHSDAVLDTIPGTDPAVGWPRVLRQLLGRP